MFVGLWLMIFYFNVRVVLWGLVVGVGESNCHNKDMGY